jgi:hypothetical protein
LKLDVFVLLSLVCPEIISIYSHYFPVSLINSNASKLASELSTDFVESVGDGPSFGPFWLEGLQLGVV